MTDCKKPGSVVTIPPFHLPLPHWHPGSRTDPIICLIDDRGRSTCAFGHYNSIHPGRVWGERTYGMVARVNIGQVILSIRCKDANAPVIQEALRRARYKFPARQKIIVLKKWGFMNVNKEDYLKLKAEKRVIQDGAYVQFIRPKGPLETNLRTQLRA